MQSVSAPTSRHLAGQGLGGRLLIDHAAAQPRTGLSAPLPAGEGKARGPKGPDVSPPCGPSTAFTKAASLGPRDPTDPLGRHCVCRTRPCWRTADASPGDKRGPPGARGTPDLDPNPRHLPGRPGPSARHRLDGGARYAQVVPDPPLRSLDFAPQAPRRALRGGSRALLQAPWLVSPQPWASCRAAHAVSPIAGDHLRCPGLPSPCRGAGVAPPMARALPPAHPSSRAGYPCPSSPLAPHLSYHRSACSLAVAAGGPLRSLADHESAMPPLWPAWARPASLRLWGLGPVPLRSTALLHRAPCIPLWKSPPCAQPDFGQVSCCAAFKLSGPAAHSLPVIRIC